jgi:hypothetical protein
MLNPTTIMDAWVSCLNGWCIGEPSRPVVDEIEHRDPTHIGTHISK